MKLPPIADPYVSTGVSTNRIESLGNTTTGTQSTSNALGKSGVSVSISGSVRSMVQGGMNASVINMEKVMAVRATIEQGAFKVNPEIIADRLLNNAQEVLSRRGE